METAKSQGRMMLQKFGHRVTKIWPRIMAKIMERETFWNKIKCNIMIEPWSYLGYKHDYSDLIFGFFLFHRGRDSHPGAKARPQYWKTRDLVVNLTPTCWHSYSLCSLSYLIYKQNGFFVYNWKGDFQILFPPTPLLNVLF